MFSIFDNEKLESFRQKYTLEPYRIQQICQNVIKNSVVDFEKMTNLSKDLREKLTNECKIISLVPNQVLETYDTTKIGFTGSDGQIFESVLMFHWNKKAPNPNKPKLNRITICLSTQVGCAMGCKFCVTGKMGFVRNLSGYEMIEQLVWANNYIKDKFGKKEDGTIWKVRNVVFMGMGEPLLNYDNVAMAVKLMVNQKGFSLSQRHVTISTSGVAKGLRRLIDEKLDVSLAISLHAPNQEIRQKIMPVASKCHLDELMSLLDEYTKTTGNRIFIEYVLIDGVTDSLGLAKELVGLLRRRLTHVNLIPFNESSSVNYKCTPKSQIYAFKDVLEKGGLTVTVRESLGRDINGACGLLGGKKLEFKKFYLHGFEYDKVKQIASFFYSFDNIEKFTEEIDFGCDGFEIKNDLDDETLNNILFHLSIALGISYYKLYPTKELIVESGYLDEYQIEFWQKFYKNGLGEFLYTNKISPKGIINFKNSKLGKKYSKKSFAASKRLLIAFGGGKESILSTEMLRATGYDTTLFTFGKDNIIHQGVSKVTGYERMIVKRKLDPNLMKLNTQGYYNGHVPITGIIAFVMEAVAYLYDYKYLVLSNEKSANDANTTWQGVDINHQYSKSLEFEEDFGKYVKRYISNSVEYFSLLRGFYEINIVSLFAKYKKYFNTFSSCNRNFKINKSDIPSRWCGKCPKCAFVYSILRLYITEEEVIIIFGKDLYDDRSLENLYKDLLGMGDMKPFECVGTSEEVIVGMYLQLKKYKQHPKKKIPYILKIFDEEISKKFSENEINRIKSELFTVCENGFIPREIRLLLNLP